MKRFRLPSPAMAVAVLALFIALGGTSFAAVEIVPLAKRALVANNALKLNGQTLADIFLAAGAKIGEPSCAACLGGPSDTFGRLNQPLSCISTTNRNFPGRMGHKEARVYLASPLTVAASAIKGVITDPRDCLQAV